MFLKTYGKVYCYVCEKEYTWNAESSDTNVLFCGPGTSVNGFHATLDAELHTKCPYCKNNNKHLVDIEVK